MDSQKEKEGDKNLHFEKQWQSERDAHEYYVVWWYSGMRVMND
jgi:hypothetical protein